MAGDVNVRKGKMFNLALRHALREYAAGEDVRKGDALNAIATKLVGCAVRGEPWAIQEIANRLDGKPAQVITGDEDGPAVLVIAGDFSGKARADDQLPAEAPRPLHS